MIFDKICAISTPPGISATGTIRCSGTGIIETLKVFLPGLKKIESRKAYLTKFVYENQVLDEIIVVFYSGPKSYTGEDMAELSFHGNPLIIRLAMEKLMTQGFRLALPGEFTRRAVMNGKMDLIKAEAIEALVNAKTRESLKAASSTYGGKLNREIVKLRESFLELLAMVEVELNYPDDVSTDGELIAKRLKELITEARDFDERAENGIVLIDGVKTAIVGRTNVGKSTLLNCLLRKERAIVTNIPGTTRDTIEEGINIDGIYFRLVDTAGIRESVDPVEKIGIDRSKKSLEEADLVLAVMDLTDPEGDKELLENIRKRNERYIVVGNKTDMADGNLVKCDVKISAKTGEGLRQLEKLMIAKTADITAMGSDGVFITERQKILVEKAIRIAEELVVDIESGITPDIIGTYLQHSIQALDEITGRYCQDDLLDTIFRNFCVGK